MCLALHFSLKQFYYLLSNTCFLIITRHNIKHLSEKIQFQCFLSCQAVQNH